MCRSAFGVLIGVRQNYRTTLVQNHESVANETKNQDVLMFSGHLCDINHKTKLTHEYRQVPSNFKLKLGNALPNSA